MNLSNNEKITVFMIEDNEMFRYCMSEALSNHESMSLVGQAASFDEAMPDLFKLKPNVVIMDVSLPGTNGIEATKIISSNNIGSHVVVLSVHEKGETIIDAFHAGADGYVVKSQEPRSLFNCIKAVAAGQGYMESTVAQKIAHAIRSHREMQSEIIMWRRKQLTKREIEILELAARGFTNEKIASHLFISPKTVKNHLSHIYQKLQCSDRTQAVLKAISAGLFEDPNKPDKHRV